MQVYFSVTLPPASSISFFKVSASALAIPSLTVFGADSTSAFASALAIPSFTVFGDAKALVESAQKTVKEGIAKADAESLKKEIEEAGGKVTLK